MAGFLHVTGNVTVSATQQTIPVPVTTAASAGNTLIGVAKGSLGGVATSVSDTQGNTWSVDCTGTISAGPNTAIIRSVLTKSLSTSDTITVTMSNASGYNISAIICEYEGAYSTVDVAYGNADNTGLTSWTITSSAPTTHDGELVVSAVGTGGTTDEAQSFAITSATPSMTVRAQSPSSPGICNAAFADGTAASLVTPSVPWSWATSENITGVIASYVSPASGGGGGKVRGDPAVLPALIAASVI